MNTILQPVDYTPDVTALLRSAGLGVADLGQGSPVRFLGAYQGSGLVGVVGLELFQDVALLRSLAVGVASRGQGVGTALVEDAEMFAAELGVARLYLLTISAAAFFARYGYRPLPRAQAPAAIAATRQFNELCPASSAFMFKELLGVTDGIGPLVPGT